MPRGACRLGVLVVLRTGPHACRAMVGMRLMEPLRPGREGGGKVADGPTLRRAGPVPFKDALSPPVFLSWTALPADQQGPSVVSCGRSTSSRCKRYVSDPDVERRRRALCTTHLPTCRAHNDNPRATTIFTHSKHNGPGGAPKRTTRAIVRGGSKLEVDSTRGADSHKSAAPDRPQLLGLTS